MRDLYTSEEDEVPWYGCLRFSPDGKFLATGGSAGKVKVAFFKVDYLHDLISPDMDSLPKAC